MRIAVASQKGSSIAPALFCSGLAFVVLGMCGCRHEFRDMVWLRTPLAPVVQGSESRLQSGTVSQISLSQILQRHPQQKVASVGTHGVTSFPDLLSLEKIPVTAHAAPDIRTEAPQIDFSGALHLLGVDVGYPTSKIQYDSQSGSEDAIQVTFSELQDLRLDERAVRQLFDSGRVHLSPDRKITTSPNNVHSMFTDLRVSDYLVAEVQQASSVSVLLPKSVPLELIKEIKESPLYGARVQVAMRDGRWELSSKLSPPRPVAAGILPLREHHSSREYVVPASQSPARVAVNLNWIESLPHPTTRWKWNGDKSLADNSSARKLLDSALLNAGLYPGTPFEMPAAVGVLTDMEVLKGEDSPDAKAGTKVNSYPWSRVWCVPFDCTIGTTREYVLLVGGEPKVAVSIDPNNTQSVNEQLKYLLKEKPQDPLLSNSVCYSLVYVYWHHWSGRYESYDFESSGIRAQNHLTASRLDRMLSCK